MREYSEVERVLSSETLNTKDQDAEKIIENTEKSLFDLAERGSFSQSFLKFNQALDQTIEMATLAMKNDKGIVGVPTGLSVLDEMLGGLHKSDLVILEEAIRTISLSKKDSISVFDGLKMINFGELYSHYQEEEISIIALATEQFVPSSLGTISDDESVSIFKNNILCILHFYSNIY